MSKWHKHNHRYIVSKSYFRGIFIFSKNILVQKFCFFNRTENKYKVTYCLTFSKRGWLRFFHSSTVRLPYRLWGLAHQKSVCASRTIMLSWNQATGSFSSAIRKLIPACQRPKSPTVSWRASDVDPRYTIVLWPVADKRKDRNFLMLGFTHSLWCNEKFLSSNAVMHNITTNVLCAFRVVTNIEVIFRRFESWVIQFTVFLNFRGKNLNGTLRRQTQLPGPYLYVYNGFFDSFKKSEACNSFK